MAKSNHVADVLKATRVALGVKGTTSTTQADAKPSRLTGFTSKPPTKTAPTKTTGATAKAVGKLARGDW